MPHHSAHGSPAPDSTGYPQNLHRSLTAGLPHSSAVDARAGGSGTDTAVRASNRRLSLQSGRLGRKAYCVRRTCVAATLLVVLAGFFGPLTPAARAESRLDVSAGYGGFHIPGRSRPVQVTVTAERLVKGELVVLGTGSSPRASLPVEVAGGSVKRFTLIVPGGVTSSSGTIDVELRVGGRALGRGKA